MGIQHKYFLLIIILLMSGCAHFSQSFISLDGSPINDFSKNALLVEDSDHPLLLRGLDGTSLKTIRVPNVFVKYAYVMKAGLHVFWVRDVPTGHPVFAFFERVHCYVIEVTLIQGMQYRLMEDVGMKRALLLNDETGETVAIGQLVDEPWVPSRSCPWE
jgi:hypothetical protein